jgi:DDE superfamily endonuclease
MALIVLRWIVVLRLIIVLFATTIFHVGAIGGYVNDEDAHDAKGKTVVFSLICILLNGISGQGGQDKGRIKGCKTRRRLRLSLESIFHEYGPLKFKRAYRMREESFWNLLDLIEDKLGKVDGKRKQGKAPNGDVPSSVRLAIALRYLAGGDPIDICAAYRVHSSVVYQSIWMVVEAINKTKELQIQFPTKHEDQQVLANEFTHRSSIGLNNCAGCVDGILIWINKPTIPELQKLKIGGKNLLWAQKKFGLNMQAVCDARRRFLDIEIMHPGATSDYLAFATSTLHKKLVADNVHVAGQPFLFPGLVLYGDNAYINTKWMVVPFKLVSSGPKDTYNFFHSQLRINIECAFGMLVHRWGILRKAIPMNISLVKTTSLVMACTKLHNFCINENDIEIVRPIADDTIDIDYHGGLDLNAFSGEMVDDAVDIEYNNEQNRIDELLDGGEHFNDFVERPRAPRNTVLPFQAMLYSMWMTKGSKGPELTNMYEPNNIRHKISRIYLLSSK